VLSAAYERFLLRVGRLDGLTLFRGSDVFWPYPNDARRWANELMSENQLPPLASSDVPILTHQGYIVYFTVGSQADPPVWRFSEGSSTTVPELAFPSLGDWILRLGAGWANVPTDD